MLLAIIFISTIIGITAIIFPPNTWDSMTYHLPRIMHWIQDHSLAYYPTSNLRQLSYSPLPEYFTAITMLITKNDYLVNMVQFVAMIGSLFTVYKISSVLKGNKILSVFLAVTLPIGILEGSSSQTDYVATFFLCSFVLSILPKPTAKNVIFSGIILGLAFMSKAYNYIYAVPFLLIYRPKNVISILGIALLLNSFYFYQNIVFLGSLFGDTHNLLFGNVFQNIKGNICSAFWFSLDEDHAGNPLHASLFVFCLVTWFWSNRKYKNINPYVSSLLLSIILFILLSHWNRWTCRFQLPVFVLICPFMSVLLKDNKRLICTILFLFALPVLFLGNPRSIFNIKPREELYFIKKPKIYKKYQEMTSKIKESGCKNVGIISDGDGWEYPLWVMNKGVRFEYIGVSNKSSVIKYPLGDFKPCYEVVI